MTADHSGSSTSIGAAKRRAPKQAEVLVLLSLRGARGATWVDVADYLDVHHGAASGLLSALHKDGKIARLSETRNRSHVYVNPGFVNDRQTEPYGGRAIERDSAIQMVQAVRNLHQPGIITEYGVPVFDEFDSPFHTYRGCHRCKSLWPCTTALAVGLT